MEEVEVNQISWLATPLEQGYGLNVSSMTQIATESVRQLCLT
jgi:hypothetical protein